MPHAQSEQIPVWLTDCRLVSFEHSLALHTLQDENCIFQLRSGKCTLSDGSLLTPLPGNSIVMLSRSTSVRLLCGDEKCELLVLRYRHTFSQPYFDLNHMCITISSVDAFLSQKDKVCVLHEYNQLFNTLNRLYFEWNHNEPERESMLFSLIHELFIKLSRSFFRDNPATGNRYVAEARAYILQNYQRRLTLDSIAQQVGVSRSYLTLLFQRYMMKSIVSYIQAVRCDRAALLLYTSRFPIVDIALETGFNNRQHFTRTFEKFYGVTPQEYRRLHFEETEGPTVL